ncbi:unnamed protein product [Cercopithifilaria johnstoni]|uniref:H15 domain-containing protein n=1 Tax=Cercopithifilaria johnstoni TaxID=2874296 RepID=A0A8J2MJW1_9BILA|nr:unnamed protein product [Cercopithifilaria johnstoni]
MEVSSAVGLPSPALMDGPAAKSVTKSSKKRPGALSSPEARSKRQGRKVAKTHPSYSQMIKEAITALKDRKGSSRAAILKYISRHYQLGDNGKRVHSQLRLAIKKGIATGKLTSAKGAGMNGSFRLGTRVEKKGAKKRSSHKQKKTSRQRKKTKVVSPKKPRMKKASTKKVRQGGNKGKKA